MFFRAISHGLIWAQLAAAQRIFLPRCDEGSGVRGAKFQQHWVGAVVPRVGQGGTAEA
jgi:hypothetical protein